MGVRPMMTLLEPHRKEVNCWSIQLTKCTRQLCLLKGNAQKHEKPYLKSNWIISNV
jgi:hypothetical protein